MRKPVKRMKRLKDHRKNYWLHLQIGFICSLTIFLVVFRMQFEAEPPTIMDIAVQEEIMMEEVIQTKQVTTPPPPPRPPVPVEVPNDEVIEDEILDLDAELDLDGPLDLPPPPPPSDEQDEEQIFIVVEQPPKLIGGIQSVHKRIIYPEVARAAGIEGRVVLQFIVDQEGNIINPRVIRGIGGGCDQAALKALEGAKFQPGLQRGRPVKVSYSLSISFNLD